MTRKTETTPRRSIYETRPVYIVKGKSDGHIERVFGSLPQAEMFVNDGGYFIIDEWPVEFKVTK